MGLRQKQSRMGLPPPRGRDLGVIGKWGWEVRGVYQSVVESGLT